MQRAYLDTEFTDLNPYTYKLISLALVVPGGPEFYVELTDHWVEDDCSDFVREIVLPQLEPAACGRTTAQARAALREFLLALGPVEIISDAMLWDWPLLLWLAGSWQDGSAATSNSSSTIWAMSLPTMRCRTPGCWPNCWGETAGSMLCSALGCALS
jgi:hypothetical protein